ncbi:MAG: LysR substrate-binding domain-containing protein [Polyangiaceae bacterium]
MPAAIIAEHLNYQHLLYFWFVAREGGIARAATRLKLTHSTISTQLKALERFFDAPLFRRQGRVLVLTPFGTQVLGYADEIFRVGGELIDMARGGRVGNRAPLRVGAAGTLPKSLVYKLVEPGLDDARGLVMRQDPPELLLEELAAGRLHLVIANTPPTGASRAPLHTHVLGASRLLLYGSARLARKWRPRFPRQLDGVPVLLPRHGGSLRLLLEQWFAERSARVVVRGEFDDAALMRVFGLNGRGLFPVRTALRAEIEERGGVELVGRLEGIQETYYAVTTERRIRDAAVRAIVERARSGMVAS